MDYLLGLQRNERLVAGFDAELAAARAQERIAFVDQEIMAADNAIDVEACLGQGAHRVSAVNGRQTTVAHAAATVTRRISGTASAGIAMP